ncbi:MAG: thioredoxin family protein [Phycisphaerales bacterium]
MVIRTARRFAVAALATTLLAAPALAAGDEGWIADDLAAGKAMAKKEGKHLLIDFTGSDWCGWCIKLDDEVFSQSQFKNEAPKNFVLVKLDFPSQKPQPEAVKTANRAAATKYAISGYPTVILADADGNAWARTGYRPDGAGPYMKHLDGLRAGKTKVDTMLADATKASGAERAKLLDAALSVKDIVVKDRSARMKEIVALDADGSAGLKGKYESIILSESLSKTLGEVEGLMGQGNMDGALEMIDGMSDIAKGTPEVRGRHAMLRAYALQGAGKMDELTAHIARTKADTTLAGDARAQVMLVTVQSMIERGDADGAIAMLDEAIAIAGDTDWGKQMRGQRDQFVGMIREQARAASGG